jgi:beta-glucanase (GH16 family)
MIASIDDAVVFELSNTDDKPFDNPHYLLLNLAMGGNLGGDISENFTEDTFEIDYVRIYQ